MISSILRGKLAHKKLIPIELSKSKLFSFQTCKGMLKFKNLKAKIESSQVSSIILGYVDLFGNIKGQQINPQAFNEVYLTQHNNFRTVESNDLPYPIPGTILSQNQIFNTHPLSGQQLKSQRADQLKSRRLFIQPDMSSIRLWDKNKIFILSHLFSQSQKQQCNAPSEAQKEKKMKLHPAYLRNKVVQLNTSNQKLLLSNFTDFSFYLLKGHDPSNLNSSQSNFNDLMEIERNQEVLDQITRIQSFGLPTISLRGGHAASQYILTLKGNCPLIQMCDRISLAKIGIKMAAHRKQYSALTMAKPYNDSMGNYLFSDFKINYNKLFKELSQFGGILCLNPNSFRRLKELIDSSTSLQQVSQVQQTIKYQVRKQLLSTDVSPYLAAVYFQQYQISNNYQQNQTNLQQLKDSFPQTFRSCVSKTFKQSVKVKELLGEQLHLIYSSLAEYQLKEQDKGIILQQYNKYNRI